MRFLGILVVSVLLCTGAMAEGVLRQIVVSGEGRVEGTPDMATISMGVTTEGKTAAEAMAANSAQVAAMLVALAEAGIEASDVQTSQLNLSPRIDHSGSSRGEAPKVVGFTASNMLNVRIRDLDAMGEILDAVLESGANQFYGLSFGLNEPQESEDLARQRAVADAMRKAALYAQAAGLELGAVISISEAGQHVAQPMMMQAESMVRGSVPIAQGEITTSASITIVFEIGGA